MRDDDSELLARGDDEDEAKSAENGDETRVDGDADPVDDERGPGPQTPESKAFRIRVLDAPKTIGQIRKVLRAKGYPEEELDDGVQIVRTVAYFARKFPEGSVDDARRYTNGIARNTALKFHAGRKNKVETTSMEDLPTSLPAREGTSHEALETRDLVHKAVGRAMEKNPRKVELYLRSEVHGESKAELATEAGLSKGRMRSYVGEGRHAMWSEMKSLLGIAVILLVVGLVAVRNGKKDDGVATPPPVDASALRNRARDECAASQWKPCADHLQEANKVDPAGETDELRKLRLSAEQHVRETPR
jgi:DNA-directed RNA polymerase specialized sigma24 family protein